MARKPRDYKAEEARRNAAAKTRGYANRAQQRRAIEREIIPPLNPSRLRRTDRQHSYASRMWSNKYASNPVANYAPEDAEEYGLTHAQYVEAYYAAWVDPVTGYKANRHRGGSPALKHWFVDITGEYTKAQYDGRYGWTRL